MGVRPEDSMLARQELATFLRNHFTLCIDRQIGSFVKRAEQSGAEFLSEGDVVCFELNITAKGKELDQLRNLVKRIKEVSVMDENRRALVSD